jgi:hypothetical protein
VVVRQHREEDDTILWQNEDSGWHITKVVVGDPNNDGRTELFLLLWQPDEDGILRSHPFLMGWRGGRYGIIWGGSASGMSIQDIAIGDLDGDGFQELITLEGGSTPEDAGQHVVIWHWQSWLFHQEWKSPSGEWGRLELRDINGDQHPEILVE